MGKGKKPSSMTPAFVRRLNEECELIRETNPYTHGCFGCLAGWCSDVWEAATTNGQRVNAKIVGNLDNGGLGNGGTKD